MANSRSIRGTLDAASGVNSSNMTTLATRMVDAITNYFITTYYPGRFLGVHKMDDNNQNYQFSGYYIFEKLVKGHGINTNQPYASNPDFGKWWFNTTNQGLKHLNDTVQFGKGISIGSADGITNGANMGFITGTSLGGVIEGNGTYRTTNIKMSDFRGLKKTDPINNNYIYNAGDGMEEIYSSGPISVGDAA